jgi:ankyrin repeat protein
MVDPNSLQQLITTVNPTCTSKLNNRNLSPLHLHCQQRNATAHVASLLLEAYPKALLFVLDSDEGWAPLHYTAANANLELI